MKADWSEHPAYQFLLRLALWTNVSLLPFNVARAQWDQPDDIVRIVSRSMSIAMFACLLYLTRKHKTQASSSE
jgi:hypothetical protein